MKTGSLYCPGAHWVGVTGSACLCFPDVGIIVVCHHAWLFYVGTREPNSASQAFCQLSSLANLYCSCCCFVFCLFVCFLACSREGIRNFYGLERWHLFFFQYWDIELAVFRSRVWTKSDHTVGIFVFWKTQNLPIDCFGGGGSDCPQIRKHPWVAQYHHPKQTNAPCSVRAVCCCWTPLFKYFIACGLYSGLLVWETEVSKLSCK